MSGVGAQPGMIQRLTVNKHAQNDIVQRDSVLSIDLKEAVEEILGKITQSLIRRVVPCILASQDFVFQLAALLCKGEASCKSTLKKETRRHMA